MYKIRFGNKAALLLITYTWLDNFWIIALLKAGRSGHMVIVGCLTLGVLKHWAYRINLLHDIIIKRGYPGSNKWTEGATRKVYTQLVILTENMYRLEQSKKDFFFQSLHSGFILNWKQICFIRIWSKIINSVLEPLIPCIYDTRILSFEKQHFSWREFFVVNLLIIKLSFLINFFSGYSVYIGVMEINT